MTISELNIKIDGDVAVLASDLFTKLILTTDHKIKRDILDQLLTMPGYPQSPILSLKEEVETIYQRMVAEIDQISQGLKINPATGQRVISGFIENKQK